MADRAGWPWVFWLLAALGGLCLLPFILFFPETGRNVVGNGSVQAKGINKPLFMMDLGQECESKGVGGPRLQRIPNPFRCLRFIVRREDSLVLASNAVFNMNYSCIQASLAHLMMSHYQLSGFQSGLCYLAYGIATLTSSYAVGMLSPST